MLVCCYFVGAPSVRPDICGINLLNTISFFYILQKKIVFFYRKYCFYKQTYIAQHTNLHVPFVNFTGSLFSENMFRSSKFS